MKDEEKTKEQLINELVELRQRIAELEETEVERKRAEEELRKLGQLQESIIDNADVWLDVLDEKANVVIWNKAAEEISGYSRKEVVGHAKIWEWLYPDEEYREEITAKAAAIIERGEVVEDFETTIRRKDGQTRIISWNSRSLLDEKGNIIGSIALGRDITERKRFEAQLAHLANHDPLTGLFNRRRFEEELERHLAQARRYGIPGALLWLDLDRFKEVNDSLGHRAGDELLVKLAGLLREQLREADTLARPGGDEFAILMSHTNAEQAQTAAARILEVVRHYPIVIGGHPVRITTSIGIVLFPEHSTTAEELLARADLAMYRAKAEGRDRFRVFTLDEDWQAQLESRVTWAKHIREALESELFLIYAQPILNLKNDQISRYELLLRMKNEESKIMLPGAFLIVTERLGLIYDIDRWMIRQAIQLIAQQRRAGRELCLEVNLSGKAFADSELLPLVERELSATGIDPAWLVPEITETAAVADLGQARRFIETLKELGCRFAIDDFGASFSSFYYLKHLPIDYLKIDGSFIRNLPHDPVDQHLVKAMVEVALALGIKTIAEHVEDEETVRMLREYGVDYAQGYQIGRPRPVSEILPSGDLHRRPL
jgi:diguanylate cyclase (GGDEF)-like protein/PAS domain S-box-containing protein